jgi:hypothetical protein
VVTKEKMDKKKSKGRNQEQRWVGEKNEGKVRGRNLFSNLIHKEKRDMSTSFSKNFDL